jgi:nitrite reductase/ring-hydroxylating ferredoxin subunit
LCALAELGDQQAREFVFGRGTTTFSMIVVRRGETVYAYVNQCPHYSTPLNYRPGQFLSEDGTRLRCLMHFAEFRIEDGFGVSGAADGCWLDPVPVLVRGGDVVIAMPEDAP